MIKYKIICILNVILSIILSGSINSNLNSMQASDIEQQNYESNSLILNKLPSEMLFKIIKLAIKSNIFRWDDIFNFDNNSLKNAVDKITMTCSEFYSFNKDIRRIILKLKAKRLLYLQNVIKNNYSNFSQEELNAKLLNELNILSQAHFYTTAGREACKLIIAGADANIKNRFGDTALICASIQDDKVIAKLLINNNANIDAQNNLGRTALMFASFWDHVDLAKLLIENNAGINIKDNAGNTAFAVAVYQDSRQIVDLVLDTYGNFVLYGVLPNQMQLANTNNAEFRFKLLWVLIRSYRDTVKFIKNISSMLK